MKSKEKFRFKYGKNILAVLLFVVCMFLSVAPVTVQAENTAYPEGDLTDWQIDYVDRAPSSEVFRSNTVYVDNSYWTRYSTSYFYDQMTDSQKNLYEDLDTMCMNYLVGQRDMLADGTTQFVSYSGLGSSEASTVACIFIFCNPQYYFLDNSLSQWYSGTSGQLAFGVYSEFVSGSQRSAYTGQIQSVLDGWLTQMAAGESVYVKEEIAHDLVTGNTDYVENNYDQSIISLILYKQSVCSGYAKTFAMLCNASGIQTLCVTSTTHAWNIINIYGNWYNVDTTWDDTNGGTAYFNVSDTTLRQNNNAHFVRNYWRTYTTVPSCTTDGIQIPTVYDGTDYSAVYDYGYYIQNNADVNSAFGNDPQRVLEHFVNYGMSEGRQAKKDFHVLAYRAAYPDLRSAFGNDLKRYYLHYVQYGQYEGRIATGNTEINNGITCADGVDYSAVYDYNYYVSANPDVAAAFGDNDSAVLAHFIEYGMTEGRQAREEFNVRSYRASNADLRSAYGNDLRQYYYHYITWGQAEGRTATGSTTVTGGITVYDGVDYAAVYDYNYYVSANPDVAAAFGDDDSAVLGHFVEYGMNEGRQAKADFQVSIYRNRYPDLQAEFGDNIRLYYLHFIQFGKNEGRIAA